MQPSLSVRVAEAPKRKDVAVVPIETLAPLAAAAGFAALSLRASVASIETPEDRIAEIGSLLDRHGLGVSMSTGDVALAANDRFAAGAVRNIAAYLDLAVALGCKLARVMLQSKADIPHAQRAADQAAARGLTLAHMTHWGTLTEISDDALTLVRRIDRPNFKIVLEPANLLACGAPVDRGALERLVPHLANVKFQNVRLDPASPIAFRSRRRGRVGVRYVPLDDASGIDGAALIAALKQVGYGGWFTFHQPLRDGQTAAEAVAEAGRFFNRHF